MPPATNDLPICLPNNDLARDRREDDPESDTAATRSLAERMVRAIWSIRITSNVPDRSASGIQREHCVRCTRRTY